MSSIFTIKPKLLHPNRRQLLVGVGGSLTGAALGLYAPAVHAQGGAKQALKLSIGRQPYAAGNAPITQYMIDNKLFEKQAASNGYDLTVDWRDYPSALPMVEAMLGGNLDLGMWGNTPIIRTIAAEQPLTMIVVGEGHFRFLVAVRKDSPIRKLQDLKGRTVGLLLGGDPYNAFSQMLRYELGSADPKALGINLVNASTGVQAATLPAGMDAGIPSFPPYLKAEASGTTAILNSFGYTEDHYQGPAGTGAGHLLDSVKKSPFYPDGYYLHRSFWVGHDRIIEKYPKAIVAFVQAMQQATEALTAMDAGAVSQLVRKYWDLTPEQGSKVVKDEVLFKRGWVWPTEGDAAAVLTTSQFMVDGKQIDEPLTWKQVKNALAKAAPLVKEAYERGGSKPAAADFAASDAQDLRGLPVWELDKWKNRS